MRLRYGFVELLLVQPLMSSYWRAPAKAPGPFPPGEDESLSSLEYAQRSWAAQPPERFGAPAAWPAAFALFAGDAGLSLLRSRLGGMEALLFNFGPLGPLDDAHLGIRLAVERASARRLGVTAAVAPRPRTADAISLMLTVPALVALARRVRGLPAPTPAPWPLHLAWLAIRQINLRRSWRRAYAASLRASQD